LVAPAGFEPAISASPGARRAHFHGGWELVAPAGFEPAISASPGARRAHFHGGWELVAQAGRYSNRLDELVMRLIRPVRSIHID